MCVTVDRCNTSDCGNVMLTHCGDVFSAPCNHTSQQWDLVVPSIPTGWHSYVRADQHC